MWLIIIMISSHSVMLFRTVGRNIKASMEVVTLCSGSRSPMMCCLSTYHSSEKQISWIFMHKKHAINRQGDSVAYEPAHEIMVLIT